MKGKTTQETTLFNPPGSKLNHLNPELLLRLWRKKGRPGVCRIKNVYGMTMDYVATGFGVLTMTSDPTLSDPTLTENEIMTKKNNGGPAYPTRPVRMVNGKMDPDWYPGKTLRDDFAGQALAGLCADKAYKCDFTIEEITAHCYRYADAMLVEREK